MASLKSYIILIIGITLFVVSFKPLYQMVQEGRTEKAVEDRYTVQSTDDNYTFSEQLHTNTKVVNNQTIEFIEQKTGRLASLTPWDEFEHVPPGEIVNVQIKVDDQLVAEPKEIWLSNRARGPRYFSWIDVITVYDKQTSTNHIAIVQRLTDDDAPMDYRQWRIIHVFEDGRWEEETIDYLSRADHPLGVQIIMRSGTSLMSMGYHTNIMQGYATIFFPLIYPFVTGLAGTIIIILFISGFIFQFIHYLKKKGNDIR